VTRLVKGFFDKLHFTESVLDPARLSGTSMRVPVEGLFVLAGHPLQAEGLGPYRGELVFDGVADSRRTVIEYAGDSRKPEGYKQPYEVVDDVPHESHVPSDMAKFAFEGYQAAPSAWIDDWVVIANAFSLHVDSQKASCGKGQS
jgi:hypothetical protein